MKKTTAVILAFIILCVTMLTASALSGSAVSSPSCTVYADSVSCFQGDIATAGIFISSNPGLAALYVKINYDSNILTVASVDTTDILEDFAYYDNGCGELILSWEPALYDNDSNGKLADITFAVSSQAPVGDTLLTLTVPESGVINAATDDISVSTENGKITIQKTYAITSDTLTVDSESKTVKGIAPGMRVNELLSHIACSSAYTVSCDNGQADGEACITTGMTLSVSETSDIYTLIVRGDVNCDGRVTVADMTEIQKVLLGKTTADGISAVAMDADLDGEITQNDFDAVKAHITGSKVID